MPLSDVLPASSLSFNQQLQLVKLQKEKLELELKVLSQCQLERPLETMLADLLQDDAAQCSNLAPCQSKPKRSIDWPQDFVPRRVLN